MLTVPAHAIGAMYDPEEKESDREELKRYKEEKAAQQQIDVVDQWLNLNI